MSAGAEQAPNAMSADGVGRDQALAVPPWTFKAHSVLAAVTFFNGFDTLAVAAIVPAIASLWKLAPSQLGVLIAAGLAGRLAGGILFGWIADRCGRLTALTGSTAIFAGLSFACAFAWNYETLLVLHAIQGVGLGGQLPVATVYSSEIAQPRTRGRDVLLHLIAFPVGVAAAVAAGIWIVPSIGWQYVLVIGAIPAMLVLFLRRLLPESPAWLPPARRDDAGAAAIHTAAAEAPGDATETTSEQPAAGAYDAWWRDFFDPRYGQRSLIVWVIWLSAFLLTYAFAIWIPTLFRTVFGVSPGVAAQYGLIIQVAGLLGVLGGAFTIDRLGRRLSFSISFAAAAFVLFTLWLQWPGSIGYVLVLTIAGYFFTAFIATGVYAYTAELYPARTRALATGVAAAWLPIAMMTGSLLAGMTIAEPAPVILILGAIAAIAAVLTRILAVETAGPLEEISP